MAISEMGFTRSNWPDKTLDFGGMMFVGSDRVPSTSCTSQN